MTGTEALLLVLMTVWMIVAWTYRNLLLAAKRQRDELFDVAEASLERERVYRAAAERARTP